MSDAQSKIKSVFDEKRLRVGNLNQGIKCCCSFPLNGVHCRTGTSVPDGVMGRWIDPSWGGPIELFLVPASAPRLV